MAGALVEFGVAGRLLMRALRRRMAGSVARHPDAAMFRRDMEALLAKLPAGTVRDVTWVSMPANRAPWMSSGLTVEDADEITTFIVGRATVSKPLDIWVSPALNVWLRVGEMGTAFRGTRASHSFRVDGAGLLYLGNYFPNEWTDDQGTLRLPAKAHQSIGDGFEIVIVRWAVPATDGMARLDALAGEGEAAGLVTGEMARLEQGETTPPGWSYHWILGPAEIYTPGEDDAGRPCIDCHTHGDVGILRKDVDLPLTPDTGLAWRWRIDSLPSTLREDTVPTHDYLSIAVEFENGRDITYYWSATLPVETGYDCPLPNWSGREYHVVVRSGAKGLGDWLAESRSLYQDYERHMGTPPQRITRVWLIANSIFQRGTGTGAFADIVLTGGQKRLQVL